MREDRVSRALIYNTIKGWADPKQFKMSIEKFWPLDGDRKIDIIMPSEEEIRMFDKKFRSIGRR